mmetsp:Transcript_20134/g.55467  ORF Transcript_20134/g.55467 Transcript_20134/m.55467 type:complete len:274 (-) Transcript_20134:343-1164(-)
MSPAACAKSLSPERETLTVKRHSRRVATVEGVSCEAHLRGRRNSVREQIRFRLAERLNSGDTLARLEAGQTGGVYTVPDACPKDRSPPMAVFKSEGEEGFQRRGILPGGGAAREEAAYLMDRLVGSAAGVPVTTRAAVPVAVLGGRLQESMEEKNTQGSAKEGPCDQECFRFPEQGLVPGAVQSFVPDVVGAAEDFGMPRALASASRVVSVAAAQKIACLDLRLCNTDRHAGNLLFQRHLLHRSHLASRGYGAAWSQSCCGGRSAEPQFHQPS